MRFRFFLALVLGCWLLGNGVAQAAGPTEQKRSDTLLLKDPKGAHISEAYRYYTEPFDVPPDPEQAEAQWRAGKFRPGRWHKTLNLGLMHRRVWMRLPVRNTEPQRLRFLWSIFNFTDSAALYCRRQGETKFTRLGTASSWTPAAERPFPARSLSFPFTLDPGEAAVLYLRADIHTGGVYLPTYIETAEHFLSWEMGFPFERHWVWLLGFYLSSALFNLVLFAFLRDRIYLWYVAYVVGVSLFLMMEDGLDALLLPAWLYRGIWSVGQYNIMLLAAAAGIRIMQLFLRLHSDWRRLNRAGIGLIATVVVFVLAYALLFQWAVHHSLSTVEWLNNAREVLMVAVFGYSWVTLLTLLRSPGGGVWRRTTPSPTPSSSRALPFSGSTTWAGPASTPSTPMLWRGACFWSCWCSAPCSRAGSGTRSSKTPCCASASLEQRNEVGQRLIAAQDAEREQAGPRAARRHGP
ncbi:7TM-DISM domain-containing protein [Hymenobacter humi]|uniref:7TM-DISM domain-containing protein n=1 Tax=Hymenobacter humi TaxID=1411620 RepID=A0ABW2U1X5_9BACT